MSELAHILAIPYPAQGHVIPLMALSHELVKHGIKVTFVNTEFTHNRIMESLGEKGAELVRNNDMIQLVSISDGLENGDGRNDIRKSIETIPNAMHKNFEVLLEEIIKSDSNKITCVVADGTIGWALEVAKKMGIRSVAFCPAAASMLIFGFHIQKLLDDEIIDSDGIPKREETIQWSPMMPVMSTTEFSWRFMGDMATQKIAFDMIRRNIVSVKVADYIICNTTSDHEPAAFALAPEITPVGPLLASDHVGYLAGNFWTEDLTCLKWLDQQEVNSVIYAAFGSLTVFDQTQLQEIALGLELSNKPFLWVVKSDMNNEKNHSFLKEFEERVSPLGKVVQWAPQQKVLSHPSIACFISHCGWNSTMEGTTIGVPFLCWPYFADQFFNQRMICDVWKIGLRLDQNGGIVTREEVSCKIKQLLDDEKFKERSMELKKLSIDSIKEGGNSNKNLRHFVEWIKA